MCKKYLFLLTLGLFSAPIIAMNDANLAKNTPSIDDLLSFDDLEDDLALDELTAKSFKPSTQAPSNYEADKSTSKEKLIQALDQSLDAETDSWKIIHLFHALTENEQLNAVERAVEELALASGEISLITKIEDLKRNYDDAQRLVVMQSLLTPKQYIAALTNELIEKIESLT